VGTAIAVLLHTLADVTSVVTDVSITTTSTVTSYTATSNQTITSSVPSTGSTSDKQLTSDSTSTLYTCASPLASLNASTPSPNSTSSSLPTIAASILPGGPVDKRQETSTVTPTTDSTPISIPSCLLDFAVSTGVAGLTKLCQGCYGFVQSTQTVVFNVSTRTTTVPVRDCLVSLV
jgi:hypothetical protein